MKPYQLIRALVEGAGGALQVAKGMGAPSFQGTLWKLCNDQVKQPARATAERIASFFRIPVDAIYDDAVAETVWHERYAAPLPDWPDTPGTTPILEARESVAQYVNHRILYAGKTQPAERVPVKGTLEMGETGDLVFRFDANGSQVGSVNAVGMGPGAYAVQVVGDHLYPVLRHGVCLIVEPAGENVEGELVFVQFTDGTCSVFELVVQRADSLTVLPVPGGGRRTIDRGLILSASPISGTVAASRFKRD